MLHCLNFIYDPSWPIKCKVLSLPALDPEDTILEDLKSYTLRTEEGLSSGNDLVRKIIFHSYSYWLKSDLFKVLEKIGIDLVICDSANSACKVVASKLKIPFLAYFMPFCLPGIINHKVPVTTSYVPIAGVSKVSSNMGFFKRFINLLGSQVVGLLFDYIESGIFNEYLNETVEYNDWKNDTLTRKTILFFQECLPTFHYPELLPPNIINIGPVLNRKFSPLSEDISSFVQNYKGTVFISFGTINKITGIDVVGQLSQKFSDIAFVMSNKEEIKEGHEVPKNLLALKWVNQTDILADSRTLAFITHAGWNSVTEAMLHAVPMIACGWSSDRDLNSLLIEERGIGLRIPTKEDFTAEKLEEKLLRIINYNKEFKENIEKYSKLLQKLDAEGKIMENLDLYFETGVEGLVVEQIYTMNWVQFYNLDVWVFEMVLVVLVFFLLFKAVKGCFVFLCCKKQGSISQKGIKRE